MTEDKVTLIKLSPENREQFILDNQYAFKYGATEEFGVRDEHFEEEGEIISRRTIEKAIDGGIAYRIMLGNEAAGGAVLNVEGKRGELELLFTKPDVHSKGIGYKAWCLIEEMYPEVEVWETVTPYFETRNIHFYVNKCGFKIVEFFNEFHQGNYANDENYDVNEINEEDSLEGMFRFEKILKGNEK